MILPNHLPDFVLPVQLSIQTTESLQNKVGRKNTPQQKNTQNKKTTTPEQPHHSRCGEKNQKRTKEPVPKEMEPYQFPIMEL